MRREDCADGLGGVQLWRDGEAGVHWEAGCVDLRRDRVLRCLRREGGHHCGRGVFAEGGQCQDDEELVRLC